MGIHLFLTCSHSLQKIINIITLHLALAQPLGVVMTGNDNFMNKRHRCSCLNRENKQTKKTLKDKGRTVAEKYREQAKMAV